MAVQTIPKDTLPGDAPCARAYTVTAQSIPNASNTLINLDTVATGEDPLGMFNATTHLFTIKRAGWYVLAGNMRWSSSFASTIQVTGFRINGTDQSSADDIANVVGSKRTEIRKLAYNDTVGLYTFQNSGGARTLDTAFATSNSLSLAWVGPF